MEKSTWNIAKRSTVIAAVVVDFYSIDLVCM
jgi:hypothetical protein